MITKHDLDYLRRCLIPNPVDLDYLRRSMQMEINEKQAERETLETDHGQVWDTGQMTEDFDVSGFRAPLVTVTRKTDGAVGSLWFQHHPRFYWGFKEDEG